MAEKNTQTFANHAHRARSWLLTALLALIGFGVMVWFELQQLNMVGFGLLCLSAAVLGVVIMLRGYATRLQDRIIRLEMQVRAARLGLEAQLARLTLRQVIALRFASDAELPELLDRAIAEGLDPVQIKRAVKNWQADLLRT